MKKEMPSRKKLLAVLVSDIHLSHRPPAARAAEPDWYGRQLAYLTELRVVAGATPIICAGDIFDKWNSPPELIEFAIKHMPHMYAIPGQHDLPNHSTAQAHRSAYGCIRAAETITEIPPAGMAIPGLFLWPFPWGTTPTPCPEASQHGFNIAVIHQYVHRGGATAYTGADKSGHAMRLMATASGYDVWHTGDNHIPFNATNKGKLLWNGGGFMARKTDERTHRPRVGLLMNDGGVLVIKDHHINTEEDQWVAEVDAHDAPMPAAGFAAALAELVGGGGESFEDAVHTWLTANPGTCPHVRKLLLESINA